MQKPTRFLNKKSILKIALLFAFLSFFFFVKDRIQFNGHSDKKNNLTVLYVFYKKTFLKSSDFSDHIRSVNGDWTLQFIKNYESNLSFNSKSEAKVGLYYLHSITEQSIFQSPFIYDNLVIRDNVILESLPSNAQIKTYGDLQAAIFNKLNLQVIELHDTLMSQNCLSHLSRFETVTHVGLPARGMQFREPFLFPANTRVLVVRNAVLNMFFFEALGNLNNLQELILVDCLADLEQPKFDELSVDVNKTREYNKRPFKAISENLITLKLIRSCPNIFNYVVIEEWSNLSDLHVDLYENMLALRTFMFSLKDKSSFSRCNQIDIGLSSAPLVEATSILEYLTQYNPKLNQVIHFRSETDMCLCW